MDLEEFYYKESLSSNTLSTEFPSAILQPSGETIYRHYDAQRRLISETYEDESYTAWTYDSFNQVTSKRDRLGRVTRYTRDSRGNMLSKEVGLLDQIETLSVTPGSEPGTIHNLALLPGVQTDGSSVNNGALVSYAVDGNFEDQFMAKTNNVENAWMEFTLPQQAEITSLTLHARFNKNDTNLGNFSISVFDGSSQVWSQIHSTTVESEGQAHFILPANSVADRVLIQNNAVGLAVLALSEIQIHGKAVAGSGVAFQQEQTPQYAIYSQSYYPQGHQNQYLLQYEYDAKGNRTEYIYNSNNQIIQINEPDDAGTGYHAKATYTYNSFGRPATSSDALGRTTQYQYDARERLIKTTYNDDSTELIIYGSGLYADLVVKSKDRNGNTTLREYDQAARLIKEIQAYSVMSADGTQETLNPIELQSLSETTYLSGQKVPRTRTTNGELSEYFYDYRMRLIETLRHPDASVALSQQKTYINNQLFSSTDSYGRKTYRLYRHADKKLIRQVKGLLPSFSLADFDAVAGLNRDLSDNAAYLITDYQLDTVGQAIATIDPRGIRHERTYDSRGRRIQSIEAAGSPIEAFSSTEYDANSNVTAFVDARGIRTEMTYTNRNLNASTTVAAGTSDQATSHQTYFLDKKPDSTYDYKNLRTRNLWHQCCGRLQATIDPAANGNGRITNNDYYGNITHFADVKKVGQHNNFHDPVDSWTLAETTRLYDARHRLIAETRWLESLRPSGSQQCTHLHSWG